MRWRWGGRGRRSKKGGPKRGIRNERSGSFGAGLLGKHLAEANASGEAGAMHLRFGDIEQTRDHGRRVAFNVAQQKQQALIGRQFAHRVLKVGTADIAMTGAEARRNDRRRFLFIQGKSLAQLADQGRIHSEAIGLLTLLESPDKGGGENLFGFHLVPCHIERHGESTMPMAFINVPLLLFTGLLGSLRDDEIGLRRKLALKFKQGSPWRQSGSGGNPAT